MLTHQERQAQYAQEIEQAEKALRLLQAKAKAYAWLTSKEVGTTKASETARQHWYALRTFGDAVDLPDHEFSADEIAEYKAIWGL